MKQNPSTKNSDQMTTRLVTCALLSAIGIVLSTIIEIPMFLPYLKYDPADIPILMGTMLFGPVAGLCMTVVVSFFQTLVHGSDGFVGTFMHIVATGSMCVVVGLIYRPQNHPTIKKMVLALVAGTLTMTIVMSVLNLVVTPLYTGSSVQDIIALLVPALIPFNLVKAGLNSIFAGVLIVLLQNRKILPKNYH